MPAVAPPGPSSAPRYLLADGSPCAPIFSFLARPPTVDSSFTTITTSLFPSSHLSSSVFLPAMFARSIARSATASTSRATSASAVVVPAAAARRSFASSSLLRQPDGKSEAERKAEYDAHRVYVRPRPPCVPPAWCWIWLGLTYTRAPRCPSGSFLLPPFASHRTQRRRTARTSSSGTTLSPRRLATTSATEPVSPVVNSTKAVSRRLRAEARH